MYFYDTCMLLEAPDSIEFPCAIAYVTIQEIDRLLRGRDAVQKGMAQEASELLLNHMDEITVCGCDKRMEDVLLKMFCSVSDILRIGACAEWLRRGSILGREFESCEDSLDDEEEDGGERDVTFVTLDTLHAYLLSHVFSIPVSVQSVVYSPLFKGYREVFAEDEVMARLYTNRNENLFQCETNEYVLLNNLSGDLVDKLKWNGTEYVTVSYKPLSGFETGVTKPRNVQQELAFDLLQDERITVKVLTGSFGSGKDALMISHAMDDVMRRQKHKKIVWVRNNVEIPNTSPIGYLPGDLYTKLLPFTSVFIDHVGGSEVCERMMAEEQFEILHLGCIRGRDIRDAIIICSEAENLTREHVQLLISRVGENSEIWFNGDLQQVDGHAFVDDNGLEALLGILVGNPLFGCVELAKTERSETAALSSLFNE